MLLSAPRAEASYGPMVGMYRMIEHDEAVTSAASAGRQAALRQLLKSTFWRKQARFVEVRQRLSATGRLVHGWDGYGSEPPNATARELAARLLDALETAALVPTQLTPTVEGGIAISFVEGRCRAVIEAYNTGQIAAATYSDQSEPSVWELEPAGPLLDSIEQIRVHLAA